MNFYQMLNLNRELKYDVKAYVACDCMEYERWVERLYWKIYGVLEGYRYAGLISEDDVEDFLCKLRNIGFTYWKLVNCNHRDFRYRHYSDSYKGLD